MIQLPCRLDGLRFLEIKVFADPRGSFRETWSRQRYAAMGIDEDFVQDNVSLSGGGILRGLHFQNPNPQGKLVTVLLGEVLDVVVDIRRSSPTFGQSEMFTLSGDNGRQLYIPAGFAHGFLVRSSHAVLTYKCSGYYSPKDSCTIAWNDPDLAIQWPMTEPLLSSKDAEAPRLRDFDSTRLFP